jgi:hypothetical protein
MAAPSVRHPDLGPSQALNLLLMLVGALLGYLFWLARPS